MEEEKVSFSPGRQDLLQLEYKEACMFIRTELNIRRVALLFVVTVEWGILSLLQGNHDKCDNHFLIIVDYILPALGFLIALIGLHNELRIKAYTREYSNRAHEIEKCLKMTLLSNSYDTVARSRSIAGIQGQWLFVCLYSVLIVAWLLYAGLQSYSIISIVIIIFLFTFIWLCQCCKALQHKENQQTNNP